MPSFGWLVAGPGGWWRDYSIQSSAIDAVILQTEVLPLPRCNYVVTRSRPYPTQLGQHAVLPLPRSAEGLEDGVVGGFGLALAVEEEGMIGALPGEVVEPALAVVEIPERDADDDVRIAPEERKELGVLFGLAR